MSSLDDDRPTADLDDEVLPQPPAGRWSAIRAWRPRLVHGLLGGLALVLAGGVWAGVAIAGDSDTDSATVAATIAPRGDEAAGRDEARAEPSPSDSPTTQASKPEPKDPQTTEAEQQSEPESDPTTVKPKSTAGCESYSGNQAVACGLLGDFGFGTDQMSCLVPLWDHESGWSTSASNPSSGAYGIPQALPGDKMASAGSDWQNNAATQISWGLGYIADRYGDPCGAWGFWQSNNWY